ncbi:YiiX/YebB-like N1pC/P60 family cysteine hydrolase [Porphyromonas crevioricanis]|uniref:Orthopoxvirus protein of uncharacterized function (DUF830) n=2 Tax=Porphyromonas crevioricanis TaxID=393921 RepID=A0A2X4PXS8_9PORP|nr:YiiX/YebB-like N1pC/P60 family cysteine hydrolase [Porphyromonas crevioricanis]GAD04874.1 hypothetical protein PORCRE_571 [Porphyromonas crevioricanis JCM 15906]SJZ95652.1 Permuted papain-like amidase enzyme, YaeF/YiiX, C92 family [Porphyromonas crevioricanis]SQH72687.1 Orthopoxvirus protein of uncharacterised function (DUF830) [Porphyromonas crevioricanis]
MTDTKDKNSHHTNISLPRPSYIFILCTLLLCSLLPACKDKSGGMEIAIPDSLELRTGDLVFRLGRAWYSKLFRDWASESHLYSHVGVIGIDSSGRSFVYHCEDYASAGHYGACREPLDSFMMASANVGIYRLDSLSTKDRERILAQAKDYLACKKPFDYNFDSDSDETLYCTEFVARCLLNSSIDTIARSASWQGHKTYGVDDLLNLPGCRLLWFASAEL